jgi:hypothetical protein
MVIVFSRKQISPHTVDPLIAKVTSVTLKMGQGQPYTNAHTQNVTDGLNQYYSPSRGRHKKVKVLSVPSGTWGSTDFHFHSPQLLTDFCLARGQVTGNHKSLTSYSLAHTCNMWAVCVYNYRKAPGHDRGHRRMILLTTDWISM